MELYDHVTALEVINIVIKARISIYVYLHHPAQKMDVDSKTKVRIFSQMAGLFTFFL